MKDTDYVAVQAHHIIPLGSFDDLTQQMRKDFDNIFGNLQKENNFIFLFPKVKNKVSVGWVETK